MFESLTPVAELGGCCVVGVGGEAVYSWVDNGICDVADFDDLVASI